MRRSVMKNGVAVMASICFMAASCGAPADTSAGSRPDTPVSDVPSSTEPIASGPQRVELRDGLVDVRPTRFDRSAVRSGGDAIDLFFWSGVEECYGVDRVEAIYRKRFVTLTIFEGREPQAETCIELAVRKVVRVELQESLGGRVVVDGGSTS